MVKDIYFYGRIRGRIDARFRFLSNYYKAKIIVDGKEYATTEHYYQSKKHAGTDLEEKIRRAPTPGKAKSLAWTKNLPIDWEIRKEDVMLVALRAKFDQNPDLAEKLLATGDANLHEDSPTDIYWGVKGADRLGKLLMKVREEIHKKKSK
ncbi:MAG: NADAR family protein [Promethearchaeota archaeon]